MELLPGKYYEHTFAIPTPDGSGAIRSISNNGISDKSPILSNSFDL
ncbi:MAG: hypothetical protein KME33_35690 [Aetokthonos hydrillicola CCALA 1050]|nr:hypothetical protein [Aetokthonos hydrillicola CCALA 1050]